MNPFFLTEQDKRQIESLGITEERIGAQIALFKRGTQYIRISRPCTIGDGIAQIESEEREKFLRLYEEHGRSRKMVKFVPASGAATRMFKALHVVSSAHPILELAEMQKLASFQDESYLDFLEFAENLERYAFYPRLKTGMTQAGVDIERERERGDFTRIVAYLLQEKGLGALPKALIPFHRYPGQVRTPIEEHLAEAIEYTKDRDGKCRIHFTLPESHEREMKEAIDRWAKEMEDSSGVTLEIGASLQSPSTHTIMLDESDRPVRDENENLLFRPAGHGALIENLNELDADIVFIKNIDNVVPDWHRTDTSLYKKLLAGYLIECQEKIFQFLDRLKSAKAETGEVQEMVLFAQRMGILSEDLPGTVERLIDRLDRPLRVCGVVKNEEEPGGGPFWCLEKEGSLSKQIVEKSQIDPRCPSQLDLFRRSTHFNPVDVVCGIKDHRGKRFDLRNFVDTNSAFISKKSYRGMDVWALELPGLWNGAMAHWNTLFVEVPLTTFCPVKTINDLLRKMHQ